MKRAKANRRYQRIQERRAWEWINENLHAITMKAVIKVLDRMVRGWPPL